MIIETPRLRSSFARSLLGTLLDLRDRARRVSDAPSARRTPAEAEEERALEQALSSLLELLRRGPAQVVLEGDRHEVEVALRHALDVSELPAGRPGAARGERIHALLGTLGGVWALTLGVRGYAQSWRHAVACAEHEAILRAAGLFHGTGALWVAPEHAPLCRSALDLMAALMLELGFVPEAELARIDPAQPLTTAGLFTLVAFHEARARARGGSSEAPELSIARLADGIGRSEVEARRGLRLWTARDALVDAFARDWGWLHAIDFASPLSADEQRAAGGRARHARDLARLVESPEVGHRWPGRDDELPPLLRPRVFAAVRLALLGLPGTGKTSFWTAQFVGRTLGNRHFLHQRDAIGAWDDQAVPWSMRVPSHTDAFQSRSMRFCPGDGLPQMPLAGFDYSGELFVPRDFSPELREQILRARGLLLFLDERSLAAGDAARDEAARLSSWFAEVLRMHAAGNPSAGSVPIAFCLHKIDLEEMLGEDAFHLQRHDVIGPEVRRELFHGPLDPRRLGTVAADGGSPLARLAQAIRQRPSNNASTRLQELLDRFLERFPDALGAALARSPQVEIFLLSSAPRGDRALVERETVGTHEPLRWMAEQLYPLFLENGRAVALDAYERHVRQKSTLLDELRRCDELERVHDRLCRHIEALAGRLCGRPWLRGLFGVARQVKALSTERERVAATLGEAVKRAAAVIGAELPLEHFPHQPQREALAALESTIDDRRREAGRLARSLAGTLVAGKANGQ